MYRDDRQLSEICRTLCELVGLHGYWEKPPLSGPTKAMSAIMKGDKHPGWSHGEMLVFYMAWTWWNGGRHRGRNAKTNTPLVDLYDFLGVADGKNKRAIGELLIAEAKGSTALDLWLFRWKNKVSGSGCRACDEGYTRVASAVNPDGFVHLVPANDYTSGRMVCTNEDVPQAVLSEEAAHALDALLLEAFHECGHVHLERKEMPTPLCVDCAKKAFVRFLASATPPTEEAKADVKKDCVAKLEKLVVGTLVGLGADDPDERKRRIEKAVSLACDAGVQMTKALRGK